MADISQASIDKLNTTLERLAGGNSSGSTTSQGSLSKDSYEQLKKLGIDALTAGGAIRQLATGASGSAIAVQAFGSVLDKVSPFLAKQFGDMGAAILDNRDKVNQATREGFVTNDILKYNREAAQAGLTTEQWNKVLKDSGAGIAGLTGNSARTAEQLSSLTREVRESDIGTKLQAYGVSQEELASYTALSLTNNRKLNLADADSRNKARDAAELLALQITETAAATGMSRDAVAQKTKAELDNVDSILIMQTMTKEQAAAFAKTTAQLSTLGPGVESLGRAIITGNFSDKDKAVFNALGPAAGELQSAIKAQQAAAKTGDPNAIKEADERLKKATADAQQRINSPEFAQVALTSKGEIAAAMKQIVVDSRQAAGTAAGAAKETGKTGREAYREGQDNQGKEARANIEGLKVNEKGQMVDKEGNATTDRAKAVLDAGQALSRGINLFDANFRTQTSAMATNFEKINTQLTQAAGVKNVTDALANPGGMFTGKENTQSAMANQAAVIPTALDKIKEGLKIASAIIGVDKAVLNLAGQDVPAAGTKLSKPSEVAAHGEGGIIKGPELSVIAEKGPEAVIPLDKLKDYTGATKDSEKISATINATANQAKSANASDNSKGKGELEMVLTDYQKTVLKYASTESTAKQTAIDNEKNIIRGTEAQIAESKQRIANIQKDAEGRELTHREQNRIAKINDDIKGFEQEKSQRKEALAVYENVDKLKAQTSADAKKAEVAEVNKVEEAKKTITAAQSLFAQQSQLGLTEGQKKMFGEFYGLSKEDSEKKKAALEEERASALAVNKATIDARDAIEEKAELEGRKLTESEQAQFDSLTKELNSSADRVTAADNAKKALERASEATEADAQYNALRAESAKESSRQSTEIAKVSADEQKKIQEDGKAKALDHVNETIRINGKIVDPNSPEAQAVRGKIEEAKIQMTRVLGGVIPDPTKLVEKMPSAADLKAQYAKMSTDLNATPEGLAKLKAQLDAKVSQEAEAAKPKAGQLGYITEKKKDMENMFGNIGGDMFNPKIMDAKQAEINKAKFAEEDKKKADEEAKKKTEAGAKGNEPGKQPAQPKQEEHTATMNDLNDQLKKLNTMMMTLVNNSTQMTTISDKISKNTKQGRF